MKTKLILSSLFLLIFSTALFSQLDAKAYFNRGYVKYGLGDHRGAIQDYTKALEINPEFAKAYYNRGNAKSVLGDYMGAIQDYTKALEINPEYAKAYLGRGRAKYNFAKYNLGNINGACLDWSKAGELGHESAYDLIKEYCN